MDTSSLPVTFPARHSTAAVGAMPPSLCDRDRYGQIVLVCQGGGALGAYQGGVFQALAEAGASPDWVIGGCHRRPLALEHFPRELNRGIPESAEV